MTAPQQTADGFLMGGGAKSAKFETPGDTVTGTITSEPEMRQQTEFKTGVPQFWDNGDPKMQLVVKLQTTLQDDPEDDGVRALYVKGGFKAPTMQKAVADAVRNAGARGLAVGGTLTVTYTGNGPSTGAGFPPKYYSATYAPPVAGAAFLQTEPAPAAPAPQPLAAAPVQATAPAGMVTLPDGSQVTPEVAALIAQTAPAPA